MSESDDRLELSPPAEEPSRIRRAPYAVLAVSGVVVSTVFATVAALAGGKGEQAQQTPPRDNDPILVHTETGPTSETSTTPPGTSTEAPTTTEEVEVGPDGTTTTRKRPRPTTTTPGVAQPPPAPDPTTEPTTRTPTQPPTRPPTTTTPPPTTTTPPPTTTTTPPGS